MGGGEGSLQLLPATPKKLVSHGLLDELASVGRSAVELPQQSGGKRDGDLLALDEVVENLGPQGVGG